MADDTIIEDEPNWFVTWLKKKWNKIDEDLDELEDEVRAQALRLFRRADWPGVRERETLYRNKVRKSAAFKVAYALVFLSSLITLYYWWGALPDLTSKLLIGLVFFAANLLMPLWARMTFWQGGTIYQPFVNMFGLAILLSVSAASIVASMGLQGTKSDEMRSIRTQQSVQYKSAIAQAQQREKRLAELRLLTSRTPQEIKAELDGLLVTEPTPQSGCNSRDNFGSWSKRNCSTVARLRVELSQAQERVRLEKLSVNQKFDKVAPVSEVDPQYEIAKRYFDVDREAFNQGKPLILAILAELIFNGLTILLTITLSAEVREEMNERIKKQKRALISQAEEEVSTTPKTENAVIEDSEPPVQNPPVVKTVTTKTVESSQTINNPVPEHTAETVVTRTVESSEVVDPAEDNFITSTSIGSIAPVNQVPDPTPVKTDSLSSIDTATAPDSQIAIETVTPVITQENPELLKVDAETSTPDTEPNADFETQKELRMLRLEKMSNDKSLDPQIQNLAKHILIRVQHTHNVRVALTSVYQDYSAWCTLNGAAAINSFEDFKNHISNDLKLVVIEDNGSFLADSQI